MRKQPHLRHTQQIIRRQPELKMAHAKAHTCTHAHTHPRVRGGGSGSQERRAESRSSPHSGDGRVVVALVTVAEQRLCECREARRTSFNRRCQIRHSEIPKAQDMMSLSKYSIRNKIYTIKTIRARIYITQKCYAYEKCSNESDPAAVNGNVPI